MAASANNRISGSGILKVKKSQIKYFFETPLYASTTVHGYELYKPACVWLSDMRVTEDRYPRELFIDAKDKPLGLAELQGGLNKELQGNLASGDSKEVKKTLENLLDDVILDPRNSSLSTATETVGIMVRQYTENSDVIRNLLDVAATDYTTASHSINVMALALGFCFYNKFSEEKTKLYGLSALMHDIGKTQVPTRLLKAPRKLTDEEFETVKQHTSYGYRILKGSGFSEEVCLVALQHHERRDGTGYPDGTADYTEAAEVMGIIDCYEAITCNERPYRSAMMPFSALQLIKKELFGGKFVPDVFESFVKSLGDVSIG